MRPRLRILLLLLHGLQAARGGELALPNVPFCLLRCKDEHMLKMDSEWSLDFAFPLLSLLKTNGSEEAAYRKAKEICYHNQMLGRCVGSCEDTTEKQIIQLGLRPWDDVCDNLRVLRTQFSCWKFHIEALSLSCYMESHRLRIAMQKLSEGSHIDAVNRVCADMNVLSKCVLEEYGRACGTVTVRLLTQLFHSSQDSVVQMLAIKWPILPENCNDTRYLDPVVAEFRSATHTQSLPYLAIGSGLLTLAYLWA